MSDISTRSAPFELRTSGSDGLTLEGYAAVFNTPTVINERGQTFREQIAPGAFARAIQAKDRVVLQFEHGSHPVIGAMPIGTIEALAEDSRGLYVRGRLLDNWMTKPVRDAIAAQAVDGMSFRFSVPSGGDAWDRSEDMALRTVHQVKLWELGPVVFPAYRETSVMVRSACDLLDPAGIRSLVEDLRSRQEVVSRTGRTRAQRRAAVLLGGEVR